MQKTALGKGKVATYMRVNRKKGGMEHYKVEDNKTTQVSEKEYSKAVN